MQGPRTHLTKLPCSAAVVAACTGSRVLMMSLDRGTSNLEFTYTVSPSIWDHTTATLHPQLPAGMGAKIVRGSNGVGVNAPSGTGHSNNTTGERGGGENHKPTLGPPRSIH